MIGELISHGSLERLTTARESIELIRGELESQRVRISIRTLGRILKTTICDIQTSDGRVSSGLGKGIGEQSSASAIFEAVEHLHSIFGRRPSDLEVVPLELDGADLAIAEATPDFRRLCGPNPLPLSRRIYRPFRFGEMEPIKFPYFLTNPYFEPTSIEEQQALKNYAIKRYSSNSGTSSGLTQVEALLHGVLEIVERDAIGVELLRTIFRKPPEPVRELARDSYSQTIQELIRLVETETNGEAHVWDITTDVGIPVALASVSCTETGSRYFGSGASLSFNYAIERALLECVQSYHAHSFNGKSRPHSGLADLSRVPNYICCLLEKGYFGYKGGTLLVDARSPRSSPIYCESMTPTNQLSVAIDRLALLRIDAYWTQLTDGPVVVTHVAAPKLERFHLVARGVPVAPSHRGRRILNTY